ncbi:MAG: DUF3261 domain-containing protein [Myxococcota bacterium]
MAQRTWLVLTLALGGSSCRASQADFRAPPVEVRSPSAYPEDFSWRQTVTVSYGEKASRTFDGVLEKVGDRLRLVGLTPVGTVIFVAEAEGSEVRFENRTGEALPFDGEHILLDVQRVFFPWLEGPFADGQRSGEVDGIEVRERVEDGGLVERIFSDADGTLALVRFLEPGSPPPRSVLIGRRFGYQLDIETLAGD